MQPKMDRQWMQIKTIARNVACFLPDDNSKTIYVFMKKTNRIIAMLHGDFRLQAH